MDLNKMILHCWLCDKEHDPKLYQKWLEDNQARYCQCGGTIISKSGKINAGTNSIMTPIFRK